MKITRSQLRRLISEAVGSQKADLEVNYQVKDGDTWWGITDAHSPGRTPEENAALNGLTADDIIQPCQELTIWGTQEYEGGAMNPNCDLNEMSNWASHNRRNQQFSKAQSAYDAMTPPDDGPEPPSADATDEEIFDVLVDYGYMEDLVEYALDDRAHLHSSDEPDLQTGIVEISDNNLNVVARYVPTGATAAWGGPELSLEVLDEAALIAALKINFIETNLADVYAENYDEIIQQQSNNYDY